MTLLRDAGRNPVHVKKDIPGFVGNRLQHALKREAIALIAAGVCDADTIDEVVKTRLRRADGRARADGADRPGRRRPDARHPECAAGRSRPLAPSRRSSSRTRSRRASSACAPARASANGRRNPPTRCASGCGISWPSRPRPRPAREATGHGAGSHFRDPVGGVVRPEQRHGPPRRGQRHAAPGHGGQRAAGRGLLSSSGVCHRRIVAGYRNSPGRRRPGWPASACCIS